METDSCVLPGGLIEPEAALDIAKATAKVLTSVDRVPLVQANGRVLAAPVVALADMPPFDACAMDGYACKAADLAGTQALRLPVSGAVAAGDPPMRLPSGTALRVLTGAPLPEGADTVIMQEDVTREDGAIVLGAPPRHGQHIRLAGSDLKVGQTILRAGRMIGPREIAAAATAGVAKLEVRARLRLALIATGSELRDPGDSLRPGEIWNVNAPMLAALADLPWIETLPPRTIADTLAETTQALRDAARQARLVVTSGGAADGDADLIVQAIREAGGTARTHRLAMKPGKPLVLGQIGAASIVGLPGNPVSAYVSWAMIALPLARHLVGVADRRPAQIWASLQRPLARQPGRREYRPARIAGHDLAGRPVLELGPRDFSARVALLAEMDGFAVLPAEASRIDPEDELGFLPFGPA